MKQVVGIKRNYLESRSTLVSPGNDVFVIYADYGCFHYNTVDIILCRALTV